MKNALAVAAISEAATGVALLLAPRLVGQLLLGEQLAGVAVPVARVAGIALVTLYLAYLGFAGVAGIFLWPAVVLHVILTASLAYRAAATRHCE
jgi:hypothetical protein